MTEEELNSQGEFLWVPDKEEVFVQAKVRTTMGKKHQVEYNDGSTGTVLKKRCMPFQRASLKRIVQDLTLLDDMSVPLILHNLRERFESQSKIYTNIGTILIAGKRFSSRDQLFLTAHTVVLPFMGLSVNPYTDLGLYTREHLRKYRARTVGESLPPHIFATASDAFYGVKAFGKLQSIVVSGESGAGKTEGESVFASVETRCILVLVFFFVFVLSALLRARVLSLFLYPSLSVYISYSELVCESSPTLSLFP